MTPTSGGHTCVFGLGWGDEGKGKVVDHLCPRFDLVVRFNGGANAGHTVCVGEETFALHLLPTGVLHDNVTGVIGPGVVVDPITLLDEIDGLSARGIDTASRLRISDRAHLVMAYHKLEDQLSESSAGSDKRIGTTGRGIGPCYADKMRRTTAIRFADLVYDDSLNARVRELVTNRSSFLKATYGEEAQLDLDAILADLATARDRLGPLVCDTTNLIHNAMDDGKRILFEGANGMLLDIDHGTYPFVTSSSTGPHGIGPGAGVMPDRVSRRIGALKAYSTRVGSGPFVTELKDETGDRIRRRGKEFGTTTGRPRRCGWFDAVSSAYAARLSGATEIAMLHLDTLSGFDQIGICVAYRVDDKTLTTPPADAGRLERAEPVIEMLPGWSENLRDTKNFDDLPATALRYLDRIESLVGAPVTIAGVGPDRSQTLERSPTHDPIDAAPPTPTATLS